jgi:hypothetical protein
VNAISNTNSVTQEKVLPPRTASVKTFRQGFRLRWNHRILQLFNLRPKLASAQSKMVLT